MGPMLRWFIFTLAMGLLPFGFSVLLQTLRGVPPGRWQNSPELLFFSVMVCAVQLGGIFDTLTHRGQLRGRVRRTLLSFGFGMYLIAAILASGLYGVYIDHERSAPECHARGPGHGVGATRGRDCHDWLDFQTNLYRFSIVIAGVIGGFGTVTEWVRTRRQL